MEDILVEFQKILSNYDVPIAFISAHKLAQLSERFVQDFDQIGLEELFSCAANRNDIEKLINRPGRKFRGPDGRNLAAIDIQRTWKGYLARKQYIKYRQLKWSAGMVAIDWMMRVRMTKVRRLLEKTRQNQLESLAQRNQWLCDNWTRFFKRGSAGFFGTDSLDLENTAVVEIHLPSFGYAEDIRASMVDMDIRQASQVGRLSHLRDNIDVIYMMSVDAKDDLTGYYASLLTMAGDHRGVDVRDRFMMLSPYNLKSFPTHRLSLSGLLKYSGRTLKRIKSILSGRKAYIVPGKLDSNDVAVADYLQVPILGPLPEVQRLYSTKSGTKRIFQSAEVAIPPGDSDIYNLEHLQESLSSLIVENINVKKWLLKMDDECDGRGTAVFDASSLSCYKFLQRESIRYGVRWNKKWAQEASYIRVLREIVDCLASSIELVDKKAYNSWTDFLSRFLERGGIVEATPPADCVTNITVDLLIEPDGDVKVLSSADQLHAGQSYSCWGYSIPQSSIEPDRLNEACERISTACKARQIVGYISIDFATFIPAADDRVIVSGATPNDSQVLWAIDMKLQYSDSLSLSRMIQYVSESEFNPTDHSLLVHADRLLIKSTSSRRTLSMTTAHGSSSGVSLESRRRYAVGSVRLHHSNLQLLHYNVFFQMCRAHGIGFDVQEKQGTIFQVLDAEKRQHIAMFTVNSDLRNALVTFGRNLYVIHKEVSAPNMLGRSNFHDAMKDIEDILGVTVFNVEEASLDSSTSK